LQPYHGRGTQLDAATSPHFLCHSRETTYVVSRTYTNVWRGKSELEILTFANTWAVFALALCGVMGKGGIDITLLWK
jgi:hypothetical protein